MLTVADDQTLDNPAPGEGKVLDWLGEVAVGAHGALAPVPSALSNSSSCVALTINSV